MNMKRAMKTDISVIVPIYNVEEFLVDCLESVKRNINELSAEVLLIDDGSTDNSSVIAKLYADKEERFFYHYKENGGLSSARNYGVSLASGKYIFFLDSDDVLVDGILAEMFETAERNKTELTVCNVARLKDKKVTESYLHLQAFKNIKSSISHIKEHPWFVYDSTSWNKLILRSFYTKNGVLFSEGFAYEDMPVNLKIHCCCNGVSVIRKTGYLWRIRTGKNKQITKVNNIKTLQDKLIMMSQSLAYVRDNMLPLAILEALTYKYLTMDFDAWLNQLHLMTLKEANEQVDLIADFIRTFIDEAYIVRLPLIRQQLVQDILWGNITHLQQVMNYKNANGSRAPLVVTETGVEVNLSNHLFNITNRSADYEFGNAVLPSSSIDSVLVSEKLFCLQGHLFLRRCNVPFDGAQYFKAILLNENSGNSISLNVTAMQTPHITESQGYILNYDDYKYYSYNYDGSGFRIAIDFKELLQDKNFMGNNYIIISYDFKIVAGDWLLKGIAGNAKKTAETFVYENENYRGTVTFDVQNIIRIVMSDKTVAINNPQNGKADTVPSVSFNSTTAGKYLKKLERDKVELDKIKNSNGYKLLRKYYRIRDWFR